jgi:hypothetical protein
MGVKGMNIKIIHPLLKIEAEASKWCFFFIGQNTCIFKLKK